MGLYLPLMKVTTLADAVERAAEEGAGRGYRFVRNHRWEEVFLTFGDVERETERLGGALQELGLRKGDRVALILPDPQPFVLTFLAALRAGVVPVPIYPPTPSGNLAAYLDNTRHIVHRSGARAIVTTPEIRPLLGKVQAECRAVQNVTSFDLLTEIDRRLQRPDLSGDDIAFLQFTSGSTSRPKGVVVTHGNLLANIRNIRVEGLRIDSEVDSALSWLPLFHDMGLIGFVLTPLVGAIQATLMSPVLFLLRPSFWLRSMSRYKATMSFGPNFAYALCVRRIRESDLQDVDLSHWRVAGCGAEPIRAQTLETFASTFAKVGFREQSFYPAYGLAESTLAVAFSRGLPTDCVDATALRETGRAVPCDETAEGALRIVSCGRAFEGHQIGVFAVDDATCEHSLPEGVVGELRVKGPSVSSGYFEDPELTARSFVDGWFRTGDLGYLRDGNTHVCGRSKELVIVNGRNFYPQDIEWEAGQVPGVRKDNVIAFGTRAASSDTESLVVVLELSVRDPAQRARVTAEVSARIMESLGVALDKVVVLDAGTLPKTSSGKLQRTKVRQMFEQGELLSLLGTRRPDPALRAKELESSQLAYSKCADSEREPAE